MDGWTVDIELVADWMLALDRKSYERVVAAIVLLRERGPALGRPLVDTLTGSRHANMKELRPRSSGRSALRLLFAFDAKRNAIFLVAGNKAGNWVTWYEEHIPRADDLFEAHMARHRKEEGHG